MFLKGFEIFSPFGPTSSLGYGLTDRSAEDEEVFVGFSFNLGLLCSQTLISVGQGRGGMLGA